MDFLTPAAMREADRRTMSGGVTGIRLMEAAGRAVAEETWRGWPRPDWSVAILCGKGNNGGDGFVAGHELLGRYRRVVAFLAGEAGGLEGDAREAAGAYRAAGGELVEMREAGSLREGLAGSDLLLDALLGTGTRGDVEGFYRELLECAAGFGGPVVAVDAPSGLDMGNGTSLGPVPAAALTVTFGAAKLGHVLGDGPDCTGRMVVRPIGLDPEAVRDAASSPDCAHALELAELEELLPRPSRRAHKRSAGVVAVLAGSRAFAGAALLTCRGALRGGAGLVHGLVPPEVKTALTAAHPEVIATGIQVEDDGALGPGALEGIRDTLRKARPDALVVGPGLTAGEATGVLIRELVGSVAVPAILLDADGLNAFAGRRGALTEAARRSPLAVTPHPGEFGRLFDVAAGEADSRRVELARDAAAELGCAVLLKGAPTVIGAPGRRTLLNLTGNQGLGRGGTGDLLSGLAGALLAKCVEPAAALALAAFAHGLAADLARPDVGTLAMTAGDVADRLSRVLAAMEERRTAALLRAGRAGWRISDLLDPSATMETAAR